MADHSGYCNTIPVKQKSSIAQELIIVYKCDCPGPERQTDSKIKIVGTDWGTEILNRTFHGYSAEQGMYLHTEMCAAYKSQLDGVAERMNRTIKEKARTLLLGVNADESLWSKAAAYL